MYFKHDVLCAIQGKTAYYEDPESLTGKYSYAQMAGFRGISMWSVSGACCTRPFTLPAASEVAGMWAAVREYATSGDSVEQ